MVDKQPKDINDFWMKVLSLMLAIMVWFIIKTGQDFPYTNEQSYEPPQKESKPVSPPPLSDKDGAEKENGSAKE